MLTGCIFCSHSGEKNPAVQRGYVSAWITGPKWGWGGGSARQAGGRAPGGALHRSLCAKPEGLPPFPGCRGLRRLSCSSGTGGAEMASWHPRNATALQSSSLLGPVLSTLPGTRRHRTKSLRAPVLSHTAVRGKTKSRTSEHGFLIHKFAAGAHCSFSGG